jgi:hypothetical protein
MEPRKFALGDRVRLLLEKYATDSSGDIYEVSRPLPAQANIWQYRVRRVGDGQERTVSEPQLVDVEQHETKVRPEIEEQKAQQRIRNARASARSQALARRDQLKRHHAAAPRAEFQTEPLPDHRPHPQASKGTWLR